MTGNFPQNFNFFFFFAEEDSVSTTMKKGKITLPPLPFVAAAPTPKRASARRQTPSAASQLLNQYGFPLAAPGSKSFRLTVKQNPHNFNHSWRGPQEKEREGPWRGRRWGFRGGGGWRVRWWLEQHSLQGLQGSCSCREQICHQARSSGDRVSPAAFSLLRWRRNVPCLAQGALAEIRIPGDPRNHPSWGHHWSTNQECDQRDLSLHPRGERWAAGEEDGYSPPKKIWQDSAKKLDTVSFIGLRARIMKDQNEIVTIF